MPALHQLRDLVPTSAACRLLGVARACLHRWEHPTYGPKPQPPPREHPSALTGPERDLVLAVLDEDRFADKAPEQVWAVLLDQGRYLCSVSTMYPDPAPPPHDSGRRSTRSGMACGCGSVIVATDRHGRGLISRISF